jgi:N-acetylglutamate synthase-like GNAT family acetyltransferase
MTTDTIVIRKAVVKDVPSVLELWKELMDFHKELDRFFSRSATGHKQFAEFVTGHIKNENSCVIVAEHNGNLVGFCLATISKYPPVLKLKEYGEILGMAVSGKCRQRGIGARLLKALRQWFLKRGIKRIEVRFATANKVAERFWTKMGFQTYLKTASLKI